MLQSAKFARFSILVLRHFGSLGFVIDSSLIGFVFARVFSRHSSYLTQFESLSLHVPAFTPLTDVPSRHKSELDDEAIVPLSLVL